LTASPENGEHRVVVIANVADDYLAPMDADAVLQGLRWIRGELVSQSAHVAGDAASA
jgi:hypothetical protein